MLNERRFKLRLWLITESLVDLKDIKAIIDLMKKNSISEFELERQDFKIRLKRGVNGPVVIAEDAPGPPVLPISTGGAAMAPLTVLPAAPAGSSEIKSPMIGTLYRAPSPDAANYVEVGAEVGPDSVVCLIEAMKVMNEIKAECRGIIAEVLVENAKPVEFGQSLFKIRPN